MHFFLLIYFNNHRLRVSKFPLWSC